MIDEATKLKVQAYVDDELPAREAREIATLLEREPEARALCAELRELRTLIASHELGVKLPETREFFWSKIEREITRNPSRPGEPVQTAWWLRYFAPAAAAATLVAMAFLMLRSSPLQPNRSVLHEIDAPLEEASTISFYEPSAGMTVVWVQTRDY